MAAPVWILSVDLQAKTASFQTGLSDAARSARGAFEEIGAGGERSGRRMGHGMMEARHSIMMLGEEFGIRIPRALAGFIAGLGPMGAALEAAFPFLAIIAGATLLFEHLQKMREAGIKLTEDQEKFGTAINNAFGSLDQKITQAQIKSDELRNNHIGALRHQLELLDKTSMSELVHSFDEVAKAADAVLKGLEGHWYSMGVGSDNAQAALSRFKGEYENLLSLGTKAGEEEAHGLLTGTLSQAKKVLELQRDAVRGNSGSFQNQSSNGYSDQGNTLRDIAALKKFNVGFTENEVNAQTRLVQTLEAQVGAEERIAAFKKLEGGNDARQVANEASARRAAAARQSAESMLRMGEQSIAAERQQADAELTVHRATLEQRLESDIAFVGRERDVKQAANQAEIAALDRAGKDYGNQLKALQEKALEINSEFDNKLIGLKAKAQADVYSRDLTDLEQSEREKIEATQQGSAARLAAIDAALKEEAARNLQDSNGYRDLLRQRIQTVRQAADEEGKFKADSAREDAANMEKMGLLALDAEKQRMALENSIRHVTIQQRIAEDTKVADEEYAIKMASLKKEIEGLDTSDKNYLNKLKQLQNQEAQLIRQHENTVTGIKTSAEIDRNQRIKASEDQLRDSVATGLTQSIMAHQTWASMVNSLGNQVVSGMIENALKSMLALDMTKEKDAAAAARKAYNIGLGIGGPAGIVLGPLFGAAAFASVMAFEGGTDRVPGVGRGDVVQAMLTPGEGVVPGGVMDGLRNVARNGGFEQGPRITVQAMYAPHVQAIDAEGVDRMLDKHADKFHRRFESTLRRMNK